MKRLLTLFTKYVLFSNRKTVPKPAYHLMIVFLLCSLFWKLDYDVQAYFDKQWSESIISPIAEIQKEYVEVIKIINIPTFPETPEEIIEAIFEDKAEEAKVVARCESGMRPDAVNPTSSARGLFQIMQSWHKIDERWLFNPIINTLVAKKLYDEQGWTPWEASRHCWDK